MNREEGEIGTLLFYLPRGGDHFFHVEGGVGGERGGVAEDELGSQIGDAEVVEVEDVREE